MAVNRRGFFGRVAALVAGALFAPKVIPVAPQTIPISPAMHAALIAPMPNLHETYRQYRAYVAKLPPEALEAQQTYNSVYSRIYERELSK